jgi:hypothetical protein
MDSSYGLTGYGSHGLNSTQGNAFVLAGATDSGKPILLPVRLPQKADSIHLSSAKKESGKSFIGATAEVVKGFGKAGVDTIRNLLTVKGLLMTAGTIGLCAMVGPAIIPFLVAGGLLTGGAQMAKGAATGNWEGVGEGLFTAGTSMVGAKFAPKIARNAAGEELILSKSVSGDAAKPGFLKSMLKGTANQVRLVLGGKVTNPANPQGNTTIYKLANESARNNWHTFKQQGASIKESGAKFNQRIDEISGANPKLQQTVKETLGTDGKVSLNPVKTQSTNPEVQGAIQQFAKEQPIAWNLSNTLKSGAIGSETIHKIVE